MVQADPRPAVNAKSRRHCIICDAGLEPMEEYVCLGVSPGSGSTHDRIWFCEACGPQVRDAVLSLSVVRL